MSDIKKNGLKTFEAALASFTNAEGGVNAAYAEVSDLAKSLRTASKTVRTNRARSADVNVAVLDTAVLINVVLGKAGGEALEPADVVRAAWRVATDNATDATLKALEEKKSVSSALSLLSKSSRAVEVEASKVAEPPKVARTQAQILASTFKSLQKTEGWSADAEKQFAAIAALRAERIKAAQAA